MATVFAWFDATPLRRWLGPSLLLLLALALYQWQLAPVIADLRDDWAFLHFARQQAIQQQLQRQPQAPVKPPDSK